MSLLVTVDEYREPLEFDLIGLGLRLRDVGSTGFSWRDLFVVVRQLPRDSSLGRAFDPENHHWGTAEQLLALIADEIRLGNWHRFGTQSQARKRNMPQPIERPGVESKDKTRYGKGALPVDEMAEWLGWLN